MRVGDHLARVAPAGQRLAEEVVHPEQVGPGDLHPAVQRLAHRDPADRGGDVVARDGLEEHGCDPYDVVPRGLVGDAPDELEELRRVHERVRDPRLLDQLLLGDLRREVAVVRHPIRAHHRQGDVVADPGFRLRGEQVAGGGLEELHHRGRLERRRVRHVDHDLRARHHLGQSFTRERVDAGARRRRHRLVAVLAQLGHQLRPDEAGSADHDDLHDIPFLPPGHPLPYGRQLRQDAFLTCDSRR